jgi:hypothetical protein
MRLPWPGSDMAAFARSLLNPTERDHVRHLWQHEQGVSLPSWAAEADEDSSS